MDGRDQLLDILDLEESLLVLVVGSPRVGSPTLGGLTVTEIQRELAPVAGAVFLSSEHVIPPCAHGVTAPPG